MPADSVKRRACSLSHPLHRTHTQDRASATIILRQRLTDDLRSAAHSVARGVPLKRHKLRPIAEECDARIEGDCGVDDASSVLLDNGHFSEGAGARVRALAGGSCSWLPAGAAGGLATHLPSSRADPTPAPRDVRGALPERQLHAQPPLAPLARPPRGRPPVGQALHQDARPLHGHRRGAGAVAAALSPSLPAALPSIGAR